MSLLAKYALVPWEEYRALLERTMPPAAAAEIMLDAPCCHVTTANVDHQPQSVQDDIRRKRGL